MGVKVEKLSIVSISTREDSEPPAIKSFSCCQSRQWFVCLKLGEGWGGQPIHFANRLKRNK